MISVGIICEYNPLHPGHLEQIARIRAHFAPEPTAIVALMSGNFVQRGEPAIYPKTARAKAAILSGADLVIELPFPYSCGSAAYFAGTGVSILHRLGAIDYLCFGSECGNADRLSTAAERLSSESFEQALSDALKSANGRIPYAICRAGTYQSLYGEPLLDGSNDILGLEYLSALRKIGSPIRPLILPRTSHYSATAARAAILSGRPDAALTADAMLEAASGLSPVTLEHFALPILTLLRTASADELAEYAEMRPDLAASLIRSAKSARTMSELLSRTGGKTYPDARVRRALLFALFRVTKERLLTPVRTVNLLGASSAGREILRFAAKKGDLPVVSTRPGDKEAESYDFSMNADQLYALAGGISLDFYKEKPFLIKS